MSESIGQDPLPERRIRQELSGPVLPPMPDVHNLAAGELDRLTVDMFTGGIDLDEPGSEPYQHARSVVAALIGMSREGPYTPIELDTIADYMGAVAFLRAYIDGEYRHEEGRGEPPDQLTTARSFGHTLVRLSLKGSAEEHKFWSAVMLSEKSPVALSGFGGKRILASQFGIGVDTPVSERRRAEDRLRPYVLAGDFCYFKAINDRLGHLIGDEAIAQGLEEMRALIRAGDHLIHPHGDELRVLFLADDEGARALQSRIIKEQFLKVLPDDQNNEGPYVRAWKLINDRGARKEDWSVQLIAERDGVEQRWLCDKGEPVVPLSALVVVSFGVAEFRYGDSDSYNIACQQADQADQDQKVLLRPYLGPHDLRAT